MKYLLIKYIKSVLWRVAKCLSYIEEARCLKVNILLKSTPSSSLEGSRPELCASLWLLPPPHTPRSCHPIRRRSLSLWSTQTASVRTGPAFVADTAKSLNPSINTRKAKYVQRNIQARSRNDCQHGQAISITYCVCVCSLGYPARKAHAPHYIITCSLPRSTIFFLSTLSYKRHY